MRCPRCFRKGAAARLIPTHLRAAAGLPHGSTGCYWCIKRLEKWMKREGAMFATQESQT